MSLLFRTFLSLWKGVHQAVQIGLLALLVAALLVACDDGSQPERPTRPAQALGPTVTPMPTPGANGDSHADAGANSDSHADAEANSDSHADAGANDHTHGDADSSRGG